MTVFFNPVYEHEFAYVMNDNHGWPRSVAKTVLSYYQNDGNDDLVQFDPIALTQDWTYRSADEIISEYAEEYDDDGELYIGGHYYQIDYDDESDIALAICEDKGCFAVATDDGYLVMDTYSYI